MLLLLAFCCVVVVVVVIMTRTTISVLCLLSPFLFPQATSLSISDTPVPSAACGWGAQAAMKAQERHIGERRPVARASGSSAIWCHGSNGRFYRLRVLLVNVSTSIRALLSGIYLYCPWMFGDSHIPFNILSGFSSPILRSWRP